MRSHHKTSKIQCYYLLWMVIKTSIKKWNPKINPINKQTSVPRPPSEISLAAHETAVVLIWKIYDAFSVSLTSEKWVGIACSIIQHYRRANVYGCLIWNRGKMKVSIFGFGAACQTTKAFPGGFCEERKQRGMLCSATWRQLRRLLFKFYHPRMHTGIALSPLWRY